MPHADTPVTQRQVSAGTPAHDEPVVAPWWPYRQSLGQLPQFSPDSHEPLPHTGPQLGHVLHALHAPHVHIAPVHDRVRVWFAQPPGHACVPVSVAPGVHTPDVPPMHVLHAE